MRELTFKEITFREHKIWVVQDSISSDKKDVDAAFSGNKAWKLDYYLTADFPGITKLISYGSAQSNMLYSLSMLAKLKGWTFDFYVDHIASNLKGNPRGNYAAALNNGAHIIESDSRTQKSEGKLDTYLKEQVLPNEPQAVYIPEGGSNVEAEQGIQKCANQIRDWVALNEIKNPKIMLPSGTGTTALFLQKHLPFDVLTCACVGSSHYLTEQFLLLENNIERHPTILDGPISESGFHKKYHFGKLYPEFYHLWKELLERSGIEFDLLYDPLGWLCFNEYISRFEAYKSVVHLTSLREKNSENYIYLHQGGALGSETMLERYRRSGF